MLSQAQTSRLILNVDKGQSGPTDRPDVITSTTINEEWFSEKNVRLTAERLEKAYVQTRQKLVNEGISISSSEGKTILRQALSKVDCTVPLPRHDMKMNRVIWFKKQLRRIRYQAFHAQSMSAGELGEKQPFIPDEVHTIIQARRSAPGNGYSSEKARSAKNTVHAWAIKKVAEAAGLHGIALTVTDLDGDDAFQTKWRRLQKRQGQMHGFKKREAQKQGRPHWHLMLYVEEERFSRLLKSATEIFGAGHATNLQVIDPSSWRLIPYMLKELVTGDEEETEKNRLALRASSFHAMSGKNGIQFLDCASSKEWDRLRRIKPDSSAFGSLNETEIALRSAAINNDYYLFIVVSAHRKVSTNPDCPLLIKKIAALLPAGLLTPASYQVATMASGPVQASEDNLTVAHRSEKKDLEPRIYELSKQSSRQGKAKATSDIAVKPLKLTDEIGEIRTVAQGSQAQASNAVGLKRTKRRRLTKGVWTWGRVVEDVIKFAEECRAHSKVGRKTETKMLETEDDAVKTPPTLEKAPAVLTRVIDDLAKLINDLNSAQTAAPPSLESAAESKAPVRRKSSAKAGAMTKSGAAVDNVTTSGRVQKQRSPLKNVCATGMTAPTENARLTDVGHSGAVPKVTETPSTEFGNYGSSWKVTCNVNEIRYKSKSFGMHETGSFKGIQVDKVNPTDLGELSEEGASLAVNHECVSAVEVDATNGREYVATAGFVPLRKTLRCVSGAIFRFAQILVVNARLLLIGFLAGLFGIIAYFSNTSWVNKMGNFRYISNRRSTMGARDVHFLSLQRAKGSITRTPPSDRNTCRGYAGGARVFRQQL